MREYMDDKIALTGLVLIAAPIGESDKRLVLLTRERGKVTVFARGARRPGNPFLAAANTFAFGTFYVKEARTAYQLVQTEIRNYFREITEDVEAACYGSYFLEFADYYARENDDGTQIIQLLYGALRAVLNQKLDRELIRYAFELRMMAAGGEYQNVWLTLQEYFVPSLQIRTAYCAAAVSQKYKGAHRFWNRQSIRCNM